jgi:PTS system mannose-specific IIA component
MIGVVVCTHASLAASLLETAEMIVGDFENTAAVTVAPGDSGEKIDTELTKAIASVEKGSVTIVLCDMFGGTPSNVSLSLLSDSVEVVTGVNLPMLLQFFTCRTHPLSDVARMVQSHGRENILVAGALLNSGETDK